MKIFITGGSGFVGSRLSEALIAKGHDVFSLDLFPSKNEKVGFLKVDLSSSVDDLPKDLSGECALINLAGVSIGARWSEEYKKKIYDSRVNTTKNLISLIEKGIIKPSVLVSASAVGVYGDRGAEDLDESSVLLENQGFLAKVARDWEIEAKKAQNFGVRTVILRQGHILGAGGLLQTLLPYYKLGIGGPIGSGKQYFPWIHIEDLITLYIECIENREISGVLNAVSPEPITNKDFSKIFAKVLKRPHFLFIPVFVLVIKFGEFAKEIVKSQKVYPRALDRINFKFKYEKLEDALKNIFS
jgi:uncharacterized protein (TIGR01777 family)